MNSLNDIFISENINNLFNGNKLNVEFIKQQYLPAERPKNKTDIKRVSAQLTAVKALPLIK